MPKKLTALSDLSPDERNANKGTDLDRQALDASLEAYGTGRSILADREGRIIAGNKTVEAATKRGLPVRVIQTDGSELVVVQRTDLDLTSTEDHRARGLAHADNRVAELDLEWDDKLIMDDAIAGVDLSAMWDLDVLTGEENASIPLDTSQADPNLPISRTAIIHTEPISYTIVFSTADQKARWVALIKQLKADKTPGDTISDRLDNWLKSTRPDLVLDPVTDEVAK